MADPGAVVTAFIEAFNRRDVDAALELVTDDVVYHNIPMRPIEGREGVRSALGPFIAGCEEVDWITDSQAVAGSTVLNERRDRFKIGGRWAELPVAGVFEVTDAGKIAAWRDYFDLGQFQTAMKGEGA